MKYIDKFFGAVLYGFIYLSLVCVKYAKIIDPICWFAIGYWFWYKDWMVMLSIWAIYVAINIGFWIRQDEFRK